MDRRRLAGIALLLAGLGLVVGARAAWPEPTWMEDLDPGDPVPVSVLARGPAWTRYDEANGTTLALFECVHQYCDHAVALRGDHREAAGGDGLVLRPVEAGGTLSTAPLGEPLEAYSSYSVSTRYEQAFEPAPRIPGPLARVAGVAMALAGAGLALGSWRAAAGAAAGGALLFAGLATNQGAWVILLQLVGVPLSLVAAGLLAAFRGTRAWWPAPATYLPLLMGSFASGALAFFPMDGA